MPRHTETRHLPYSPEQMFDLVADVTAFIQQTVHGRAAVHA